MGTVNVNGERSAVSRCLRGSCESARMRKRLSVGKLLKKHTLFARTHPKTADHFWPTPFATRCRDRGFPAKRIAKGWVFETNAIMSLRLVAFQDPGAIISREKTDLFATDLLPTFATWQMVASTASSCATSPDERNDNPPQGGFRDFSFHFPKGEPSSKLGLMRSVLLPGNVDLPMKPV
jgi:hypothetical protein